MTELLNDLIKSVKNVETDFYMKIVKGYINMSGYDYGLLLSKGSSGVPCLVASSGLDGRVAVAAAQKYSGDYDNIFESSSGNKDNSLPFSYMHDGLSLIMVFRCCFNGILVLVRNSDSAELKDSRWIEPFSEITLTLIDIFHEKIESDNLISKYREESIRRNRYLTGLTNELRTPMNAIAGFAQLMKEPDLKPENISKYVDIISDTSENIISRISSYSDIAEIEDRRVKVLNSVIRLNELLREVCDKHNKMFIMKGLILEKKNMEPGYSEVIIGDEAKIRQILDIFLLNACQNTFSGKVIISCTITGDFVEFCVTDTGSGMNNDSLNRIFDYREGQSSLVLNSKGSGLGLLIAKSYTSLMGGKISCRSEEGKGSQFSFTIPYSPVADAIINIKSGNENDSKISGTGKKKILVAEDDNLNFQIISNFLSKLNLEVIRAENGKEAVDIFKSDSIDLILMDIRMPVMDGYTAARLIREISSDVKIIAQTAYSNDKSVAVSNGCNDFISKPFSRNQLISLVTSYL